MNLDDRVQQIAAGFALPIAPVPLPKVTPLPPAPPRFPRAARSAPANRHPFEVYVASADSGLTSATVFVAWGTVLAGEDDVTDTFDIPQLDNSFTLSEDDWVWLEAVFSKEGDLLSCDLNSGGTWADFPALYRDDGEDGNTWYQPLAHVRAARTGKSGGTEPDSGEFPDFVPSLKIAQLTHTHLVKKRECTGDDSMVRIWKLVPGAGGG